MASPALGHRIKERNYTWSLELYVLNEGVCFLERANHSICSYVFPIKVFDFLMEKCSNQENIFGEDDLHYETEGVTLIICDLIASKDNALRMRLGAERMCMPSPSVEQFVEAVKLTVLKNQRWVPPAGKGALYIRPLLMGSGAVLGLAPAPEYTFLIFVSPVGNYFKEGLAPINLVVENEYHRATLGGTGGVKTIGNYASVLKAQAAAMAKGYTDVLYLDSAHKRYLEEVSSCNVFVVKDKKISTPELKGTILPGITRKSIMAVARKEGYEVEERPIPVEELLDADEVFCTGTAVVVSPVGSITYLDKRSLFCLEEKHQILLFPKPWMSSSLRRLQFINKEDGLRDYN
ncbi:branched-chain-amino-acid transaminase [Ranunculus cassubicifolius]